MSSHDEGAAQFPWTGERYVPEIQGNIALEHLHRYALACELAAGKRVLDVACGEGYGSAMLAEVAQYVVGVDSSREVVLHASKKYTRSNLEFKIGPCADLPVATHSIDLVASFETIEHHDQHEQMLLEIKRVLRPAGVLVISSPDKYEYSVAPNHTNPYHVKELYRHEFEELIARYFGRFAIYGQRALYGSAMFLELVPSPVRVYSWDGTRRRESSGTPHPQYIIAVASDGHLPSMASSVFEQPLNDSDVIRWWVNAVGERDEKIRSLHRLEAERAQARDLVLQGREEELQTTLQRWDAELERGRTLEAHLSDARAQVAELRALLAARDDQIATLDHELCAGAERLCAVESQLRKKQAEAADVRSLLNARDEVLQTLQISKSWRLTLPLRQVALVIRRARLRGRAAAAAMLRRLDRHGSLRFVWRRRRDGVWASFFGYSWSQADSGLEGRMFQTLKSTEDGLIVETDSNLSGARQALGSQSAMMADVWVADGTAEWADYSAVRNRIAAIAQKELISARPRPPAMLNLAGQDLSEAASRLTFSTAGDAPEVSIIIPVYNHLKYTLECLLSVRAHTGEGVRYEVIVADDASVDDTRRVLSDVPNVRLICNDSNVGFLLNCNRAAVAARGRYILFLNNDVQVTEGWLEAMIRVFREERDVGAVGPMIVFPDGRLQEAGARIRRDGSAEMIGLFDSPERPRFNYRRDVDYCSGACLLMETHVFRELGGFDERYVPAYCEDSDLCMRVRRAGKRVVYCHEAVVIHHLSKTVGLLGADFKKRCVARNVQQLTDTWQEDLDRWDDVRVIAFYLPQFHPTPENDLWWGKGFTEWSNVARARPNFVGHYQPRIPADLGYYDLRVPQVLEDQAELARRYGIGGFCFYYYWFGGKRVLEGPLERMFETGRPEMPFCVCWANENWTRRWDGRDADILIGQTHSDEDDARVIEDLTRYFRSPQYIRVAGKPLVLVYRVTLFPDFARTARIWRRICQERGVGDVYIAMVESFELVRSGINPARYGCDASVEFPPQEFGEVRPPSGAVVNGSFRGSVCDYRDLAVRYATRPLPGYTRFRAVMPGWDNTARRQDDSWCFEHATPGAFQAWLESAMEQTKQQCSGDERLVFVNAWNEWAEGAYLEPDGRFGHTFLEAIRNAREATALIGNEQYGEDSSAHGE